METLKITGRIYLALMCAAILIGLIFGIANG